MSSRRSNQIGMFLPAWVVLCCAMSGCHRDSAPAQNDLKIIHPDFPKPVFISAPWHCTLPNFEPLRFPPQKEFTAPADAEILSLHKPVTSSAPPSKGQNEWITDGDAFCGGNGEHAVFFENLPCWVQIDLGSEHRIDHLWLWHDQGALFRRATPEVFEDVIVQLCNDATFRYGVTTLFNSDDDGSCGQGKGTDPTYTETNHGRGVPANGQKARYVRVWGGKAYSGGACRFTEVTVWGR